jgi:hypothetical protein
MECVPGPSSMPQRGIAAIAPLPEQPQSPVAVHSASQVESGSRLVTPRSMGFQGSRTEQMPRQPGTLQGTFDARYTVSDAFVGSTRMAGEHVEKAISTDSKERHVSLLVCTVAFAPDVDYCSTIDQGTQRHKKYTGQNSRNFPTVRGSHGSVCACGAVRFRIWTSQGYSATAHECPGYLVLNCDRYVLSSLAACYSLERR